MSSSERIRMLSEKLSSFSFLEKYGSEGEPGHWSIAYHVSEIAESCKNIEKFLRSLEKASSEDEARDILIEIGEEIEHILYHARECGFFGYLFGGSDGSSENQER